MFRKFLHPVSTTRPLHPIFSSLSGKDLGCCVFEESMAGRVSATGAQTIKWALRPEGLKPRTSLALHYGPDSPVWRRNCQMMPGWGSVIWKCGPSAVNHLILPKEGGPASCRESLKRGSQYLNLTKKNKFGFNLLFSVLPRLKEIYTLGLFNFFRLGASTGIQNSVSRS